MAAKHPLAILILAGALGSAGYAAAEEPYLAIRTGLKCSQCHVNRSGGGGRNAFGSAWAQTQLPARTLAVRSRGLNDWVSVGFDVRARFTAGVTSTTPQTAFDMPEGQVQVEARFVPNALAFYLDQGLVPDAAFAREAFALVEWRPLNGYAKAGKFMLPFGWRLWDDGEFVRAATGFTYATPDLGLEVGIEPGPLSWFVAVSNGSGGNETNSEKLVTSQAALVFSDFRLGASAARRSDPGRRRDMVGGFGGFRLGPLAVLGEADWIFHRIQGSPDRDQMVAFAEGDLLLRKGINAKVTYGYSDPDLDVAEDQAVRFRAGIEVFPVSFVQVSAFYVLLDDPQVTGDVDQIALEVHLHF